MDAKELLEMTREQEQRYQFPRFPREDVWELGCDLVEACRSFRGPLAVEIDIAGTMVFRYFPAGTGAFHAQWLERKRKTVQVMEKSSLRVSAEMALSGETMLQDMRLDPMEYGDCGGGFPLRMKDGCIFGFAGVSGLADTEDHAALIAGLDRYFKRHHFL